MGKLYRFTLEEYKQMKREWNAVETLIDSVVEYKNELTSDIFRPAYYSDLETWKNILKKLESPYAGWQGADADSYLSTAKEICAEFDKSHEEMVEILTQMREKLRERSNELLSKILECEQDGNMTLGGNIVVQGANLLGVEVE